MNTINWQSAWIRAVSTLMTLALMALIFSFSMEPAEASDATSGFLSMKVIRLLWPNYNQETPERQQEIYDAVQHVVRKCAHFLEYLALGFLMRICLLSWFGPFRLLIFSAWAAGTLYAGSDELHQLMIDGRSGQWTDVALDSTGVLCGVLLSGLFIRLAERIYRKGR
ncbi:MAG: VanZ family protein [Clostridia bacterium]|nr:VanZ family protein [Clostridia bacterium]